MHNACVYIVIDYCCWRKLILIARLITTVIRSSMCLYGEYFEPQDIKELVFFQQDLMCREIQLQFCTVAIVSGGLSMPFSNADWFSRLYLLQANNIDHTINIASSLNVAIY